MGYLITLLVEIDIGIMFPLVRWKNVWLYLECFLIHEVIFMRCPHGFLITKAENNPTGKQWNIIQQ